MKYHAAAHSLWKNKIFIYFQTEMRYITFLFGFKSSYKKFPINFKNVYFRVESIHNGNFLSGPPFPCHSTCVGRIY